MNSHELKVQQAQETATAESGLCMATEPEANEEAFTYEPMPPQRVLTFKVRLKVVGRGEPLPYPFDEDEDE